MTFDPMLDGLPVHVVESLAQEVSLQESSFKAVKSGKVSAMAHQIGIYRRLDVAIEEVTNHIGLQPACMAGCSYCCHYHVYISAPESLAIAMHIQTLPVDQRALYMDRLKTNAAKAKQLGLNMHMKTNVRCAFLADSGDCSIYPIRPVACRRHHSMNMTPCRTTFEDPNCTDQASRSADILATADRFNYASHTTAASEGFDNTMYEMSGAILEAMTNNASIRRWKSGKVTFPSVEDRVKG